MSEKVTYSLDGGKLYIFLSCSLPLADPYFPPVVFLCLVLFFPGQNLSYVEVFQLALKIGPGKMG